MEQTRKPDWESESYTVPTDGLVDTLEHIGFAGGRVVNARRVGAGVFITVVWEA